MKIFWLGLRIMICVLLIGAGTLAWAWSGSDIRAATISRGFFVGGALALLFGFGSFRTSYSFVQADAPSYSTAFYNTLRQRKKLMFADMAEHLPYAMILLGAGVLSLVTGFLIMRFG